MTYPEHHPLEVPFLIPLGFLLACGCSPSVPADSSSSSSTAVEDSSSTEAQTTTSSTETSSSTTGQNPNPDLCFTPITGTPKTVCVTVCTLPGTRLSGLSAVETGAVGMLRRSDRAEFFSLDNCAVEELGSADVGLAQDVHLTRSGGRVLISPAREDAPATTESFALALDGTRTDFGALPQTATRSALAHDAADAPDVDGNGFEDMIRVSEEELFVYLGSADGFELSQLNRPSPSMVIPGSPGGTAFDFDLDGDSDLALSPGTLLEADLPSDYSVAADLPGTSTLWSNAVATDLNGDGDPDLLAGNAFEVAAMLAPTFEPAFVPLSNDPALVLPEIAEFHRGAHLPEPLTAPVVALVFRANDKAEGGTLQLWFLSDWQDGSFETIHALDLIAADNWAYQWFATDIDVTADGIPDIVVSFASGIDDPGTTFVISST